MEKNITIRTADKGIAEDLHAFMGQWFDEHINFIWWDGAWELSLDANGDDIDSLAEEIRHSENFKENKLTFKVE